VEGGGHGLLYDIIPRFVWRLRKTAKDLTQNNRLVARDFNLDLSNAKEEC